MFATARRTASMEKLAQDDLDARLSEFPEWSVVGEALQRTFSFEDFAKAMAFVNQVASLAEDRQHHPDIMIRYGKVTLTLSTHDAGGITEKDFDFARAMDESVDARVRH
jgi:4a-hydroxytetrahydrobiopterin dehydratase